MTELLQSTAQTVVGRGYLAADHIATATGLDPAITISKNGGNFANPAAGASVMTEIESTGWYKFALGTGDTDTLGPLIIRGTHATMDNIEVVFQVVAVSVAQTGDSYARLGAPAGASVSADIAAIEAQTDDIGVAGAGLTALATAAELAKVPKSDGVVTWNATALAALQQEATDALNAYDPPTNAEMVARTLVAASYFDPAVDTVANVTTVATTTNLTNLPAAAALEATLTAMKGATFSGATDSLEALRDRGDAAWITATGFATPTNITAGTITTVTNLTNAPTNGDLTAAMKASVNAEVDAALNTAIPGAPTADSLNQRIVAIDDLTQAAGAGDLAAILLDTGTTLDTLIKDVPTNAELATALAGADDATLAAIAALNNLSSAQAQTAAGAALTAYDPPTNAELEARTLVAANYATAAALTAVDDYVDAEVTAIKAVTDKLDTALVLDGLVYDFTAAALAAAPTGGSAPTVTQIRQEMDANSTKLADILTDTGTTLDALIKDVPTNAELATALSNADDAVLAAVAALNDLSSVEAQAAAAAALLAYGVALEATAQSILTDTGTTLPASLAGFNDITVADIIAGISEGALDLQEILRIILAAVAGKASGGGSATITFRDQADTKNRIVATVDVDGNRSAVVVDGS